MVKTYHWLLVSSHWTGCATSPDDLSVTLLNTLRLVPPYTNSPSPLSALFFEAANLNWELDTLITKRPVSSSIFSGRSPSSLINITFSPVDSSWVPPLETVKILDIGELIAYSFTELLSAAATALPI